MFNTKLKFSEAISIVLAVFFAHSIMSMPRDILATTTSRNYP